MRKIALLTTVVVVGALLAISGMPALSQQPGAVTTITLFDPNPTDFEKHVRGSGDPFRPGDWHVYVDRLLDPDTCDVAARVVGRFVFVKMIGKSNGWLINDATVTLAGGRLTMYGAARFSDFAKEDAIFAINGGTGAYGGASGDLSFATTPETRCGQRGVMSTVNLVQSQ